MTPKKIWPDGIDHGNRGSIRDMPAAAALFPVSVVAVGAPAEPVERLIALQSATARAVQALTEIRQIKLRLPFQRWAHLRFR
jgi:hypothetical protein